MYTPGAFRQDDILQMHQLMQEYSFATLITMQSQALPQVSHLPFLLESTRGAYGVLASHMAHANGQWRAFSEQQEVLVIFQGPHAYVSPSWYEDNPLNVPTWNYAVVHAYGRPRIIEESEGVYRLLQSLVEKNEANFERPWVLHPIEEYAPKRFHGLVGFEIEITRLEGKFKLSQNRPMQDRVHVAEIFASSDDPALANLAMLMNKQH